MSYADDHQPRDGDDSLLVPVSVPIAAVFDDREVLLDRLVGNLRALHEHGLEKLADLGSPNDFSLFALLLFVGTSIAQKYMRSTSSCMYIPSPTSVSTRQAVCSVKPGTPATSLIAPQCGCILTYSSSSHSSIMASRCPIWTVDTLFLKRWSGLLSQYLNRRDESICLFLSPDKLETYLLVKLSDSRPIPL